VGDDEGLLPRRLGETVPRLVVAPDRIEGEEIVEEALPGAADGLAVLPAQ